jgi:hypothetical protein
LIGFPQTEPQSERRRLDPMTCASMIDIVPQGIGERNVTQTAHACVAAARNRYHLEAVVYFKIAEAVRTLLDPGFRIPASVDIGYLLTRARISEYASDCDHRI